MLKKKIVTAFKSTHVQHLKDFTVGSFYKLNNLTLPGDFWTLFNHKTQTQKRMYDSFCFLVIEKTRLLSYVTSITILVGDTEYKTDIKVENLKYFELVC